MGGWSFTIFVPSPGFWIAKNGDFFSDIKDDKTKITAEITARRKKHNIDNHEKDNNGKPDTFFLIYIFSVFSAVAHKKKLVLS